MPLGFVNAGFILIVVAIILTAAAVRDLVRHRGRLTPAARTWFLVATIFIVVTLLLRKLHGP